MIGFKSRTLVVGGELQVKNCCGCVQMNNSSGLQTENDSGEL